MYNNIYMYVPQYPCCIIASYQLTVLKSQNCAALFSLVLMYVAIYVFNTINRCISISICIVQLLLSSYIHTVQLTSKLTLACGNTSVFFYFCRVIQSELACDMRVNFRVEHVSYIYFVHCMRPIFMCYTIVKSKQVIRTSCATRESVFLCAPHKLLPSFTREESRHTMKWHASKK